MRLSDQRSVPARRSQLLRLLWFGPALALVMIVGIAEPTLLPPLTVLLFMAVVLRSLAQRHGPR